MHHISQLYYNPRRMNSSFFKNTKKIQFVSPSYLKTARHKILTAYCADMVLHLDKNCDIIPWLALHEVSMMQEVLYIMEKFQKFSSRIVIGLALVWAALTFTHMIPVKISYMIIGGLAAYIGVQNIILLNWGLKIGKMPNKISYQIEQHGHNKGIRNFVVVNVLLYLIIGIVVVVSASMM